MIIETLEVLISSSANAKEAVRKIQQQFGGDRVYIPAIKQESRNSEIRKAFTGNNHREVCLAFDISLTTLWRIIRVNHSKDTNINY